jgi:hypothetical protein
MAAENLPKWVAQILDHFTSTYLGEHGLIVTSLDAKGNITNSEPLIADFGDVLPFLYYFGQEEFALEQVRRAKPFLWHGLYSRNGLIQAFYNHDWLLGLLELYQLSNEAWLLDMATEGVETLYRCLGYKNVILDSRPNWRSWRNWLPRANPFNGGYIEIWVELYKCTGDHKYLEQARALAQAWIRTPFFERHGLFRRIEIVGLDRVSNIMARFSQGGLVQLFKDNTNLVYGLLALFQQTGETCWLDALERWVEAFTHYFWNNGNVYLWLDRDLNGHEPHLKASFSALDLLCDLHHAGVGGKGPLQLAKAIGDFWLEQQWPSGLFPEKPGATIDHLDANVDMIVALTKLSYLVDNQDYEESARRCQSALLELHSSPYGYVQAVGRDGQIVDNRVIVKYQGLLLKTAILREGFANPYDVSKWALIRDR